MLVFKKVLIERGRKGILMEKKGTPLAERNIGVFKEKRPRDGSLFVLKKLFCSAKGFCGQRGICYGQKKGK